MVKIKSQAPAPSACRGCLVLLKLGGGGCNQSFPPIVAAFLRRVVPAACKAQRAYGIPASLLIALAALMSQWGRSALARNKNNLFGMRRHRHDRWCFSTLEACFDEQARFLANHKRAMRGGYVDGGLVTRELSLTDIGQLISRYRLEGYDALCSCGLVSSPHSSSSRHPSS